MKSVFPSFPSFLPFFPFLASFLSCFFASFLPCLLASLLVPLVKNPRCQVGCGPWQPPQIPNTKYKGRAWSLSSFLPAFLPSFLPFVLPACIPSPPPPYPSFRSILPSFLPACLPSFPCFHPTEGGWKERNAYIAIPSCRPVEASYDQESGVQGRVAGPANPQPALLRRF